MILHEYPKSTSLMDGTRIIIRPLRKADQEDLYEYFLRLPPEDRMGLKDDVTNTEVVENWIYELDYDIVLPLLAIDKGRVVANATLHFSNIGWTKHQGEIRITNDPDYRQKGLGTRLIQELIEIAAYSGLEQLTVEVPSNLDETRSIFKKLGFNEVAAFKKFIKDAKGEYADLVLMIMYI